MANMSNVTEAILQVAKELTIHATSKNGDSVLESFPKIYAMVYEAVTNTKENTALKVQLKP